MAGGELRRRRCGWLVASVTILVGISVGGAWAGLEQQKFRVSQKDQAFRPGELSLKRGDAIDIANDDDDLLHHAYVDSEKFKFDSGDQEPGTTVEIVFPVTGTFMVLCGIHPRMKLKVHVD